MESGRNFKVCYSGPILDHGTHLTGSGKGVGRKPERNPNEPATPSSGATSSAPPRAPSSAPEGRPGSPQEGHTCPPSPRGHHPHPAGVRGPLRTPWGHPMPVLRGDPGVPICEADRATPDGGKCDFQLDVQGLAFLPQKIPSPPEAPRIPQEPPSSRGTGDTHVSSGCSRRAYRGPVRDSTGLTAC
jgi:hypothetical protein